MKKFGFTLAEVLITLGIIGVVAALTLPNLRVNTANAKVGPALAKAASMFEQANELMLEDIGNEAISQAGFADAAAYIEELSNFIKGRRTTIKNARTNADNPAVISKDGIAYLVSFLDAPVVNDASKPHKNCIGTVDIDINGLAEPNAVADDHFVFGLFDDGSLRPKGHVDWQGGDNATKWETTCNRDATPTDPSDCAAHIFDNGLKVLYK